MATFISENILSEGGITGTTINGGTFYGDGSNLTGVSGGGTFTGGTVNGFTEFTNGLSANTISGGDLIITDKVDTSFRMLFDSTPVTSIDWENRMMKDATNVDSLDWRTRNLYDNGAVSSLNWTSRVLTDSNSNTVMDWENKVINNINGLTATTISAATYLNLSTGDLASVQVVRTTPYTLTAVPALITFDSTSLENQPLVISHDNINTERIYVYEDGLYSLHYHCDVGPGTVSDFEFALVKNTFTILSGSTIEGKNSSTDKVTAGVTTLTLLNTGDYISLAARYIASSSGLAENTTLSVTKMDGVVGPTGNQGPEGPAGTGLFTGGTITSPTNFTGGLTANTFSSTTALLSSISATTYSADTIQLDSRNDPSPPTTGNLIIYSKDIAGRQMPKWIGPSGLDTPFQPNIMFNNVSVIGPGGGTTVGVISCTVTSVGTISNPNITSTNLKTQTRRIVNTSGAGAGSLASTRIASLECWRGNAAGLGGFFVVARFGQTTLQNGMRMFIGLTDTATAAPTNIDPTTSTTPGKIGMAINASTGNWNLVHNITGTAPTVIPLGASYPVNTTDLYELILYAKPNDSVVTYRITNLSTTAQTSGTLSSNLPATTTPLGRVCWATNNATAAAVAWDLSRFSLESDY
jgi:hypothetical protein